MAKGQPMDKGARLRLVADAVRKLEAADAVQAPTMDAQERRVERVLASHGKLAYSVAEAAEAMSVSQWYIRDEIARGNLHVMNSRGRKIIPGWELLRYLEENMSTAPAPAEVDPAEEEIVQQALAVLREWPSGYRAEPVPPTRQVARLGKPAPAPVVRPTKRLT